jgi:hypothetical protein
MTDVTEAAVEAPEAEAPKRGRPPKPVLPEGHKLCRVLKNGAGKVSKGFFAVEDDGQNREQYFAKGDEFTVMADIADALEDRGFVET